MSTNPWKEYEASEKVAYKNSGLPYWICNFWAGRADGIEWCIKHLNDKSALKKEYDGCLTKKKHAKANDFVQYYEGRADGVQWCLDNFDNLELPEDPGRKEE